MLESFTGISICLSKQTIRVSLTASWSSPHKYLINCQAYANLKSQICDWERLTVFSQQLPQEPWIPQVAQAHYRNADVTLACWWCCVTNGYLQRLVWDVRKTM